MRLKPVILVCLLSFSLVDFAIGQAPIPMFATNNSGFIQNGPDGADNLVFFQFVPDTMATVDSVLAGPPVAFTIIGDLTLGTDIDGNGVEDSLGTFSGLEWSGGTPGAGTLIGCVLDEGHGNGEFYQIDPTTGQPTLIGQAPIDPDTGQKVSFSDLALNPVDGLMYGLVNDIIDDGMGDVEFGPNTIWVDTNGDLIPDTRHGEAIRGPDPFCIGTIQTLSSGMAFDEFGLLYIYDSLDEEVLGFGFVNPGDLDSDPCVFEFDGNTTAWTSSELTQGNGLGVVGLTLVIGTDAVGRNSYISFYEIPDPNAPPPDPEPEIIPAARFGTEFFETQFFASVSIGDLVGAEPDLTNLPPTFPDNIIVNIGTPAKNAVLEAVAVSDDFRYCIFPNVPKGSEAPVDVDFVFTVPNPGELSLLGLEVESQANSPNLGQFIRVFNLNTGVYDVIDFNMLQVGADNTIVLDLTFVLDNYVDPTNGTLICKIETRQLGLVPFYPWQVKYDSVLVISE